MVLYPPYSPEDYLLRPCDPTQHSDDWPIFTLNNASIFAPLTPDLDANLLQADANNPLVVTGKLSALPASMSHLRAQKTSASERGRSEMIALHEVRSFAYGQFEDGGVQIWAAGHAGWFSISPSRRFKETYLEMEEAVSILYFVADIYSDPTTKVMEAEALFRLWAFRNQLQGGAQAAAEAFYKHRRFLIDRMVQGKEGFIASRVPLYKHFELKFKDDVDDVRRRLGKKVSRVNRFATPSSQAGTKRKRPGTELGIQGESSRRNSGAVTRETRSTRSATVETSAQASDFGGPSTPIDNSMYSVTDLEEDVDDSDIGQQAGKGKSVLRPRQSKYIPKVATAETDADEVEPPSSPVRRLAVADDIPLGKGKTSAATMLPPPPPSRNRSNRTPATHDGQAIAGADDVDEGIDMSLDQASELEGDESGNPAEPLIDGKVPLRLRDQDMQATAAGDTWLCPLDGCLHKVYAAQTAESQQLIKEHYRLHVTDDDANMRMHLLQRMAAPGLPVSRLMDKIQSRMIQGGYPAPIQRRY